MCIYYHSYELKIYTKKLLEKFFVNLAPENQKKWPLAFKQIWVHSKWSSVTSALR